ncbi:MAG: MAPEG family protein [Myxococcota bacterium]
MTHPHPMLFPVIALALWSHVMWAWMYATRIPAVKRARIKLDRNEPRGAQMATLPPRVRWKSDNYTNLMEQPTVFYAVALSLAVYGQADTLGLTLAWAYVAVRATHSVFQATVNIIPVRFCLFALSGLTLIALTVRAAVLLF